MAGNESIRGYRIVGDRKPERTLSMDYLMQSHEAATAQRELWITAAEEGAPCVGKPELYTPDELPTDREAARLCATCPLAAFAACTVYVNIARPAFGVYAGVVRGRKLQEALESDE